MEEIKAILGRLPEHPSQISWRFRCKPHRGRTAFANALRANALRSFQFKASCYGWNLSSSHLRPLAAIGWPAFIVGDTRGVMRMLSSCSTSVCPWTALSHQEIFRVRSHTLTTTSGSCLARGASPHNMYGFDEHGHIVAGTNKRLRSCALTHRSLAQAPRTHFENARTKRPPILSLTKPCRSKAATWTWQVEAIACVANISTPVQVAARHHGKWSSTAKM